MAIHVVQGARDLDEGPPTTTTVSGIMIAAHRRWFSLAFLRRLLTSHSRIGRGVVRSALHLWGKFAGMVQAPPPRSSSFERETERSGPIWTTQVEVDGLLFVTCAFVHAFGSDQSVRGM
jgi:hypothetical protein